MGQIEGSLQKQEISLSVVILAREREFGRGNQVIASGDIEEYLSRIDAFRSIAGPGGSYQLLSDAPSAAPLFRTIVEQAKSGQLNSNEVREALKPLTSPPYSYNCYPNILERLVAENLTEI